MIDVGDRVQVFVDEGDHVRAEKGRVIMVERSGTLVIELDEGGEVIKRKPEACHLLSAGEP